jgi:predicted phage terminase large subunit-like protein
MIIAPQPGPQTKFLSSSADISIYGGAAGGGKTFGILLDPIRYYDNPKFGGVIFRRTSVQIRNQGGLWDESCTIYPHLKGRPREFRLQWLFPSGMTMSFANLEYDKDVYNYQGSQMPWIGFDELTHFSEFQFFYMLSRNRSAANVKSRIRANCNPDPDSWVRKFIDWWIDEAGYPIKERSGVLRYFIRINGNMIWADSKEQLYQTYGRSSDIQPKSVTFISAKLQDNQILMQKDPGYMANLLALSHVDRMRLLEGNWNVRAAGGNFFRREWFPIVDVVPAGWIQAVRYFDRAATKPNEINKDPDWTRGIKLFKYSDGTFCVVDLKSIRDTPGQVEKMIKNVAAHDGPSVKIMAQQDPGSAGVAEAENFIRMLAGYDVHTEILSKDKITRCKPFSAQCEANNIKVLRAPWNDEFFNELENFPEGAHDDICDAASGAFNSMSHGLSIVDALWNYRK